MKKELSEFLETVASVFIVLYCIVNIVGGLFSTIDTLTRSNSVSTACERRMAYAFPAIKFGCYLGSPSETKQ